MNIHDIFVAFSHHQHFGLLPSVLQPVVGKGKSFALHTGVINPSLLNQDQHKFGPSALQHLAQPVNILNPTTLNPRCALHSSLMSLPLQSQNTGQTPTSPNNFRSTDSSAEDQMESGGLSFSQRFYLSKTSSGLENTWRRAESLSSPRSSGCC